MPDQNSFLTSSENYSLGPTSLQWFREIVTAVIALTIVAIAAWTLVITFSTAELPKGKALPALQAQPADAAAFQQQEQERREEADVRETAFGHEKDVLLYVLGLMGTVTGYFFGRVPAELHASQAEKAASTAQGNADQARKSEAQATLDKSLMKQNAILALDRIIGLLASAPNAAHLETQGTPEKADEALQQIRSLRDSLDRS